jgi:hypothetical protein
MFGKRERVKKAHEYQHKEQRERFQQTERHGQDIYRRIAALKTLDRERLPTEVMRLFSEAKQQTALIRQSIKDRTNHNFDGADYQDGDLATFLAEDIAGVMRDNVTNPQTVFQAAVSMVAAIIREQRLDGIIEGLELAEVMKQ